MDMSSVDFNEELSSIIEFSRSDSSAFKLRKNRGGSFKHEINRIPSMPKLFYSVSSVATQADMDNQTVTAERKDYKYRNQMEPDVESQIISIEIDLCTESASDIKSLTRSAPIRIKNYPAVSDKEVACVKVNDLVAFRNCLSFQLEAAKAAANIILNNAENKSGNSTGGDLKARKMVLRMSARNMHRLQKNQETQSDCFKYELETAKVEDQIEINISADSEPKPESPFYHAAEEWNQNSSEYLNSSFHNNNFYLCAPNNAENKVEPVVEPENEKKEEVEEAKSEEIPIDVKLENKCEEKPVDVSEPLESKPEVMSRSERLKLMLEQERLILESAKKKKSKKYNSSSGSSTKRKLKKAASFSKNDRNSNAAADEAKSQVAYKKLNKRPTFKLKSNKVHSSTVRKRGYINSNLLKGLEDRFALSTSSFVKFNRLVDEKPFEGFLSN